VLALAWSVTEKLEALSVEELTMTDGTIELIWPSPMLN
jgi:hypothetical protein